MLYDPDFDDGSEFGEGYSYDEKASNLLKEITRNVFTKGELRLLELGRSLTSFELFISKSDFGNGSIKNFVKDKSWSEVRYLPHLRKVKFITIIPTYETMMRSESGCISDYNKIDPNGIASFKLEVSVSINVV